MTSKIKELKQTSKTINWIMTTDDGKQYKVTEYDDGNRITTGYTMLNGDEIEDINLQRKLNKLFHNKVYGIMFKIE